MRRVVALTAFLALGAALSLSFMLVPTEASRAASETGDFVIPAADGYGATRCLERGEECGAIVAQSWCNAHGFSRAVRFGAGEEGALAISCAR
ncbi:hypothetical protein [Salinarimonas ramus]|uniref:Uncharacterized protein n=1 Tax=Salinarimonas ramus TaxID=690164 RepID=A0A917Q911_9HYPH|nr:hypothetical protein [Salinarimonas ramus]GGK37224.1 hypothetical protein GCM10011322_25340 [Salinarimonas ramus]